MESNKKEMIVQDACILIDLINLDLINDFFQLNLDVFTTPQVISEVTDEMQIAEVSKHIESGSLQIDGNGSFDVIAMIYHENPGLSFADGSVLELAIRKEASILSSDGSLRKTSVRVHLNVHGILWIVEQLCLNGIVTIDGACEKLNNYVTANPRAPKKESKQLISILKNRR